MYGSGVLCVLSNYRRPQNLPRIIAAWKGQSIPPARVVVVDNSRGGGGCREPYPNPALAGADDVWRFTQNAGCSAHFAPALLLHGHRYVLFADDDVLPGSRALEHLLKTAEGLNDRFSTLGVVGRNFHLDRPPGQKYSGRNQPPRGKEPNLVHLTCQAHLIQGDLLPFVLQFRNTLVEAFGEEAAPLVAVHDDFLLCCGAQAHTSFASYLLPLEESPEQQLIKERLEGHSDLTAVWRRPNHFQERNRMVEMCLAVGWRPVK